jgi:hypothetical protein
MFLRDCVPARIQSIRLTRELAAVPFVRPDLPSVEFLRGSSTSTQGSDGPRGGRQTTLGDSGSYTTPFCITRTLCEPKRRSLGQEGEQRRPEKGVRRAMLRDANRAESYYRYGSRWRTYLAIPRGRDPLQRARVMHRLGSHWDEERRWMSCCVAVALVSFLAHLPTERSKETDKWQMLMKSWVLGSWLSSRAYPPA